MKTNLQLAIILFILLSPIAGWWYLLADMYRTITIPITSRDYRPLINRTNYHVRKSITKLVLSPGYLFLRKTYRGLREITMWLRWISNRTDIESIRNETELLSSKIDAHFTEVNSRLTFISQIVETHLSTVSTVSTVSQSDELASHSSDTGVSDDISARLENIKGMLQTSLRDQHEELRNYRDGVVKTAQKPFIMEIIHIYDLLVDISGDSDTRTDVDLINKVHGIKDMLVNALSQTAGVVSLDISSDEFQPASQDIVSLVDHDETHPAYTRKRVVKKGFQYRDETEIIRKEQIEIYR